ncbi:protein kinase [archaeon]|jgi:serine/threonine protein kinase|nr:protein kinase [archaeon]
MDHLLEEGNYTLLTTCVPATTDDGLATYVKTIPLPPNLSLAARAKEERRISELVRFGRALTGNPHHVDLLGYTEVDGTHQLVYSAAAGKDVAELVQEGSLTIPDVLTITRDIANALVYAHNPTRSNTHDDPIIHGDLSPTNVKYDGEVARIFDHGASIAQTIDLDQRFTTRMHRTPGFAGPEIAIGEATTKSDVFGLGMLLAYMVTGEQPKNYFSYVSHTWKKHDEFLEAVRLRTTDNRVVKLIEDCTMGEQTDRPTAAQVVSRLNEILPTALDTIVLADAVASTPTSNRTEWDVPHTEATRFVRYHILRGGDHALRDNNKLTEIDNYLRTEPVSPRDREILTEVVFMIGDGQSDKYIESYLKQVDQEKPELIFGNSRSSLTSLLSHVGASNISENSAPSEIQNHPKLLELVEYAAEQGVTASDLTDIFNATYGASRKRFREVDQSKLESYIKRVKAGEFDDRVSQLREEAAKNQASYLGDSLNETGVQALHIMLEEEEGLTHSHLAPGGDSFQEVKCRKKLFGNGIIQDDNAAFGAGIFSAIGTGLAGVAATVVAYNHKLLHEHPLYHAFPGESDLDKGIDGLNLLMMNGVAGLALGALAVTAGYFAINAISARIRKNKFDGLVDRKYSTESSLDAVDRMVRGTPTEKLAGLVESIEEVGQLNENQLLFAEIADNVLFEYEPTELRPKEAIPIEQTPEPSQLEARVRSQRAQAARKQQQR